MEDWAQPERTYLQFNFSGAGRISQWVCKVILTSKTSPNKVSNHKNKDKKKPSVHYTDIDVYVQSNTHIYNSNNI